MNQLSSQKDLLMKSEDSNALLKVKIDSQSAEISLLKKVKISNKN